MKKWLNKNRLHVIGAVLGAVAGFLYWKFVGCSSGTCMITSKPFNSSLYGAVLGSLSLGIFQKNDPNVSNKKNEL